MDFGGELFWVIMLIFYLVFQVLGARKKQQEKKQRRPGGPPTQAGPASAEPRQGNELDEALSEIRRALGYPDPGEHREEPAISESPGRPAESPSRPVEKPLEGRSVHDEPPRVPQARKPLEGRSIRNEPSRFPPRKEPLESRTLRNEPTRIPRPEKRPPKPVRVERRTPMYGGSIYAPDASETVDLGDAFEAAARKAPSALTPSARKSGQTAVAPPDDERSPRLPHIVKKLQTPSSAREAILMKEILDPPRAMRRRG